MDSSELMFAKEEQFREMLCEFFRPYVEDGCSTDEIEIIEHSLRRFAPYLRRPYFAGIYMEFVFSVFEILRTTNSHLIRNILEVYILHTCNVHDEPLTLLSLDNESYFFKENSDLTIEGFELSSERPMYRDSSVIQRLFRYGVRIKYGYRDVFMTLADTDMNFGLPYFDVEGWEQFVHELRLQYPTPGDERRLTYIFGATCLGLEKEEEIFKERSKVLELLFKTIPEPLITVKEVYKLLKIIYEGENNETFIRGACEKFGEEFPKSKLPLQPRKLQHLSRCRIRESLGEAGKQPHGVWNLPLPKILQNYILMQRREDEFHPKYVSVLCKEKQTISNSSNNQIAPVSFQALGRG